MSDTPITCWLIERGQAVGHEPTLWWGKYPDTEMERWTRAASDAMRFPTMEAAQRYANLYSGPHCTVTEHVFLDREVAPVDVIGLVVDEFLRWPLPASVCSDPCACTPGYPNRSGTNLLTAQEARQMFEFLIGKLPRAGSRIERAATESCCRRAEALERELAALREQLASLKAPVGVEGVIALCRRSLDRDVSTLTSEQALASQCLSALESLAAQLAAALEENARLDKLVSSQGIQLMEVAETEADLAKLRQHAEAMAESIDRTVFSTTAQQDALAAYRADFPEE